MSFNPMDSELVSEVIAVCNDLGHKNKLLDNKYILNRNEANNVLKDLIRFLRNDDRHRFPVRRQLGTSNIVDNDLIPIVEQYSLEDLQLFDRLLRLLIDLTNPSILQFQSQRTPKEKMESQKYIQLQTFLYSYKQSFGAHKKFWTVIAKHLSRIIGLDDENRQIEDTIMFERILVLIRNVLHIPIDPESQSMGDEYINPQDRILEILHISGINDLLLLICNDDTHQDFCFHLIEIISLMFREQNAEFIAKSAANYQQNNSQTNDTKSDYEKELDRKELQELKARDKNLSVKHLSAFTRFKGTYYIKNMKSISDREMIFHKNPEHLSQISFDLNKEIKRKSRNRKPMTDSATTSSGVGIRVVHKSGPKVRKILYDFCSDFINDSYNQFMRQIKDNLDRKLSQENDETYYLWAIQFFMEFNRSNPKLNDNMLVSETMSIPSFHFLQTQIEHYLDLMKTDKENLNLWSKRLHYGLKAYRELLFSLNYFDSGNNERVRHMTRTIKKQIFYEVEYKDLLLTLLSEYDEAKMSKLYLKDLIETNHVFLKLLENYYKTHSRLVVREKVRKIKRKKSQKKKEKEDETPPEEVWNAIISTVSEALSGSLELPKPEEDITIRAFDPTSEKTTDEQKLEVMRRVNKFLKQKLVVEAIALYRDARNVWSGDEDNAFGGPDISPEDELLSLNQILMTDFPNEITAEEQEENEIEEEFENNESEIKTREKEIELNEVINKYCHQSVVRNYALLLRCYDTNSDETNHCIVKMLHRIGFDCKMHGMLFQVSVFRTFQRILSDPLRDSPSIKELSKFAKYIVSKFISIAQKNPIIFIELLFWKNCREANDLEEGYQPNHPNQKTKQLWTEEQELELNVLFEEFKDKGEGDKDYIDLILENMIDKKKTRRQLIRQLKQQGIYVKTNRRKNSKNPKKHKSREDVNSDDESIKEFPLNNRDNSSDESNSDSDEDIDKETDKLNDNELNNENSKSEQNKNIEKEIKELMSKLNADKEVETNAEDIEDINEDNVKNYIEDSSDESVVLKIDENIETNARKRDSDDSENEELVAPKKKRRVLIIDSDSDSN